MGFKDANWAYSLDLPMAQKVVLAAICQRTDDKTHTTLVGQQTVAEMIGMSVRSVHRAVGVLDDLGIITREPRRRSDGYRSSDAITINRSYTPESHVTDVHMTESHVTESPTSHDTQADLTRQSVMTIDVNQLSTRDQPVSATPKPKRPAATGTRLPEGWLPSAPVRAAMKDAAPLVDLKTEHERFTDYWIAQPGARGRKTDWDATWRNWMRKANDDAKRLSAPKSWEKPVGRPMTLAEERARYLQEVS